MNLLSNQSGHEFDNNGQIGQKGKVNNELLNQLNSLPYYSHPIPKSLVTERLEKDFYPILNSFQIELPDKMRTVYEHITIQIKNALPTQQGKVLLTGGGTHNKFLISLIEKQISQKVHIPEKTIIDYKEALIFAFLGVLSKLNIPNCLASYTGGPNDMVCGEWF